MQEAISQGFELLGGAAQCRSNTLIFSFTAISIFCSVRNCFAQLGRQLFSVNDTELEAVETTELAKRGGGETEGN